MKITYSISFESPLLRHQARAITITPESFVEEIAPAAPFAFLKEVEDPCAHRARLGARSTTPS